MTLRTLGEPALVRCDAGREELLLDLGKPLALLTYLTCIPGHTSSREYLVELLWADLDPEAAKHGLRQALWIIKKRVGEALFGAEGEGVKLAGSLRSDRGDLLAAAERGDLEKVIALYRGDFFPHFAALGSGGFEHWADLERARLRSVFLRSLDRLARCRLDHGRTREAVDLARRLRDSDRLHQGHWRLLLEAMRASSDALAAEVETDAFKRLLQDEGLLPEPATKALLDRTHQADSGPRWEEAPRRLVVELVGREREFAMLLDAWRRAERRRPSCARVVAPAGLGKTRLLNEVVQRLRAGQARVVTLYANQGTRDVSYALASHIAEGLASLPGAIAVSPATASILVGLNPRMAARFPTAEPIPIEPGDLLRLRIQAVHDLLAAVSEDTPIALFVDDWHWADPVSRQVLAGAVSQLRTEPVLVVVAERGRPAPDGAFPQAQILPLAPLTVSAVTALVSSCARLPPEPWAEQFPDVLHASSGGSPFLVLETLYLALQRELLVRGKEVWSAPDPEALLRVLAQGGAIQERLTELQDEDRRLLSLLAAAGTPLSLQLLAAAASMPEETVEARMRTLESRALAMQARERWEVAHDEIASRALEPLSDGERRAGSAAVGRAVLQAAGEDPNRLRLAARHLVAGSDCITLRDACTRFVKAARLGRDDRQLAILVAEFLGESVPSHEVHRLISSLPARVRWGVVTPRRLAAAIAVTLLIPGGLAGAFLGLRSPSGPPPDAVVAVAVQTASALAIYETGIATSRPVSGNPITVRTSARPTWRYQGSGYTDLVPRPGRPGSWVATRTVPDTGDVDLFLLSPERGVERLTFAPGIDLDPSWSPDGEQLVFATGRWNELQHYDLAILDLRRRTVKRLTASDATDHEPRWSPDGTRIAFHRKHWDGSALEICAISVNGAGLRCQAVPGGVLSAIDSQFSLESWLDDSTLVIRRDQSHYIPIRLGSFWGSGKAITGPRFATLSPNGRWLVPTEPTGQWQVFRVDDTTDVRLFRIEGPLGPTLRVMAFWAPTKRKPGFLDRLVLAGGSGPPRLNVPYHLRVQAFNPQGAVMPLRSVQFGSSDPALATVDSNGILYPSRTGTVTITASAGGWRATTGQLTITTNRVDTLLDERWSAGIVPTWVPFGNPKPAIDTGPAGIPGLNNRGDGRFVSGVYSVRRYDLRDGLGMEALLSTPIGLPQWQTQSLSFQTGYDSTRLAKWDHLTGEPWMRAGIGAFVICEFDYPTGPEGPVRTRGDSMSLVVPGPTVSLAAPPALRSGEWYRVRLQIFPDGRCGVALNGRVLAIAGPREFPALAQVFLHGLSYRTKMLVGPLKVWKGVATDIRWHR